MIIRGTTPVQTFELPESLENCKFTITYKQQGNVIFKRTHEDCAISDNIVTVNLTQNETLMLIENEIVEIQFKIRNFEGNIFASDIINDMVYRILDEEPIE